MSKMNKIIEMFKNISEDIPSNNQSIKGFLNSYFKNPSFRLLLNYRIGKYFYNKRSKLFKFIAGYLSMKQLEKRSSQIHYKAHLGKGIRFSHPIGIVIGAGVKIENNVTIWQHVTIGSHGKPGEKKYPKICENVKIYAGAKIFGEITIGKNSVIGANAVVNINVPENGIAVGIPAHIIKE